MSNTIDPGDNIRGIPPTDTSVLPTALHRSLWHHIPPNPPSDASVLLSTTTPDQSSQSLSHLVPNHLQNMIQDHQTLPGKRKKGASPSPVGEKKNVQASKQMQPEKTPNLSSTYLTNSPASESYELSSLMWLLRIINYWKEQEELNSSTKHLSGFYKEMVRSIQVDLPIKEPPKTPLVTHIQNVLSRLRSTKNKAPAPLFLTLHRDGERWSESEQAFLKSMAFDPQHGGYMKELKKGTLSKIAITLNRSMQECQREWNDLFQQMQSSSEKAIQPSPVTVSNRLDKAETLQFNEWEKAMIDLWIKQLEQIKPGQPPWMYRQEIAKSFCEEPRFKNPCNHLSENELIFKMSDRIETLILNAQDGPGDYSSLSRNRSEEFWYFIEKKFLEYMLLTDCKHAKESLKIVLSLLGRAPVDVDLNTQSLKDLLRQVQNQPRLRKLETMLNELIHSENLKGPDDTLPPSQDSTDCSSTVQPDPSFDRSQGTTPTCPPDLPFSVCKTIEPVLPSQKFIQEPEEEDNTWHNEKIAPRQELDPMEFTYSPTLQTPKRTPVDSEASSSLFDPNDLFDPNELNELRLLSSLLSPSTLDNSSQTPFATTASTDHFSSTAPQTVTSSPLFTTNEEMPKKRWCPPPPPYS